MRLFIILLGIQTFLPVLLPAENGKSYMERLEHRTAEWQKIIPEMKKSAEEAADRIIAGGNLYAAGPQESFKLEPLGRAGGMLLVKKYNEETILSDKDIIIAACIDDYPFDMFMPVAEKAAEAGCRVILFSSSLEQPLPENSFVTVLPARKFSDGNISPSALSIESVSNVIGMWTWIAEFTSECVKRGKMPCFFESYSLPGAKERYEVLKQSPFHTGSNVTPADVKNLGLRYLQSAADSLAKIRMNNQTAFRKAADLIRNCHANGYKVWVGYIGHMFPGEFKVKQNPAWFLPAVIVQDSEFSPEDAIIILGYQAFPWIQTAIISGKGNYCILTCSHAPPAEFTGNPKNIYINPFWEMTDAAISINNYDAKILPLSGIMQAAIFWQLVETSK